MADLRVPCRGTLRRVRLGNGVLLALAVITVGCGTATAPTRAGGKTAGAPSTAPTDATTAAPASPRSPVRGDYLALGDSVAFGYRPPAVTTTAQYRNAGNFKSYADDLAAAEDLSLTNASCPGETTASMISATATSNGCENGPDSTTGYRTVYPLHVDYAGSQLSFAIRFLRLHPRTRLVTIDIGANDAFICQATTRDHCGGVDASAVLARVQTNLATIYAALRAEGGYRGTIVALEYYALSDIGASGAAATVALNAAISKATRAAGGVVANGFGAFQAAAGSGDNACAKGLLIRLPGGTCNIHPTAYGHRVLAQSFSAVLGPVSDRVGSAG